MASIRFRSPGGEPTTLLHDGSTRFDEPELSPDGQYLAYVGPETGQSEVYVRRVRDARHLTRISTHGGGQPVWRQDGRELFYIDNDGWIVSVRIERGREISFSPPAKLFRPELVFNPFIDQYGVSRDGERFLVLCPLPTRSGVNVVMNWTPTRRD